MTTGYMETTEKVLEAMDHFKKAEEILSGGPSRFYFWKMRDYATMLFERFAPVKPGDRVRLTKAPVITDKEAWGWTRYKHILIEGALATVYSVDASDGKFLAYLRFDKNTWISSLDDKERPSSEKEAPLFCFHEGDFEKVAP